MAIYKHTGTAATVNIKSTDGQLQSLAMYNSGASNLYVQFFEDANTAEADDDYKISFPLPAGGGTVIDRSFFEPNGEYFGTGIAIGISSDATKYTAHGTPSEVTGTVMYQ